MPSLALIAVVGWLVMSGLIGGESPPAGNETLAGAGAEPTPSPVDPGAEVAATGDKAAIKVAAGAIGKSCGGCHKQFRGPKKKK